MTYWVTAAEASRGISLPNMKSDPIFWERGREKEEKYFIKKHLTPVWVPPLCCLSLRSHISSQLWHHKLPIDYLIMLIRFAVIKGVIEVSGPSARVDRACLDARRCQGDLTSPSGTWVSLRPCVIREVDSSNGRGGSFDRMPNWHSSANILLWRKTNLKMVFRSRLHGHTACGWLIKMFLHFGLRMTPVHEVVWYCE